MFLAKRFVPAMLAVLLTISSLAADDSVGEFDRLAENILSLRRANQEKLRCYTLEWTYRSSFGEQFIDAQHVKCKKAGRSAYFLRYCKLREADGQVTELPRQKNVYDGSVRLTVDDVPNPKTVGVSDKLSFMPGGDWPQIGWGSPIGSYLSRLVAAELTGVTTLRREIQSANDDGVSEFILEGTNQRGVRFTISEFFDLTRGGCLVRYVEKSQGHTSKRVVTLLEPFEGFWIPSQIRWTGTSEDGTVSSTTTASLTIDSCTFNSEASIPKDAFDIEIRPNMKVLDHRAGFPVVNYTGVDAPLAMDDLKEHQKQIYRRIGPEKLEKLKAKRDREANPTAPIVETIDEDD